MDQLEETWQRQLRRSLSLKTSCGHGEKRNVALVGVPRQTFMETLMTNITGESFCQHQEKGRSQQDGSAGTGVCLRAWWPESHLQDPPGRRGQTLQNCSLTSTHIPMCHVHVCTHAINKYNGNLKNDILLKMPLEGTDYIFIAHKALKHHLFLIYLFHSEVLLPSVNFSPQFYPWGWPLLSSWSLFRREVC